MNWLVADAIVKARSTNIQKRRKSKTQAQNIHNIQHQSVHTASKTFITTFRGHMLEEYH